MWKKIVAPIGLVTLLWIASSSATTFYLGWLEESHMRSLTENVSTIQASATMESRLWRLHAVILTGAEGNIERLRRDIQDAADAFERAFVEAEGTSLTDTEKMSIANVRRRFDRYHQQIERRLDAATADEEPDFTTDRESFRLASAVADGCRELTRINEHMIDESALERAEWTTNLRSFRMIIMGAGPLLGLLLGFWIARGLHRSVSQISVTLSDAAGLLNPQVGHVLLAPSAELPVVQEQVQSIAVRICEVVDELQQARSQVLAAERLAAVGELAAGVAHDLRNPLTAVKLLVQMAIRKAPESALTEKQLEVIEQEIGRMENTIQSLLDFARPPQLRRVPHDLRETVRRAITLLAGRAQHQRVEVLDDLGSAPLLVDGDPEQLHQAFVNLVLNGIEAMQDGGRLAIAAECAAGNADHCRVIVADSGPGIPPEVLPRVFDPFVTTKQRGTGLGLAICHRIVEEHHGEVSVANGEGGGARFTVELPLSTQP